MAETREPCTACADSGLPGYRLELTVKGTDDFGIETPSHLVIVRTEKHYRPCPTCGGTGKQKERDDE